MSHPLIMSHQRNDRMNIPLLSGYPACSSAIHILNHRTLLNNIYYEYNTKLGENSNSKMHNRCKIQRAPSPALVQVKEFLLEANWTTAVTAKKYSDWQLHPEVRACVGGCGGGRGWRGL